MFMSRMSKAVQIGSRQNGDEAQEDDNQRAALPSGVEVFRITGPFFFGVASELLDTLRRIGERPKVFILRLRLVPFLDTTGANALRPVVEECLGSLSEVADLAAMEETMKQFCIMLTILVMGMTPAHAQKMCPDGTFVSGSSCRMAPDGSYVSGDQPTRMAPDGTFKSGQPRLAPNGKYVRPKCCCDGNWSIDAGQCDGGKLVHYRPRRSAGVDLSWPKVKRRV